MAKPMLKTPLYESQTGGRFRMKPGGMDRADITDDEQRAVQRIALGVFTDMSNAGFSLRETLAAIYLTGAHHAVSVMTNAEE